MRARLSLLPVFAAIAASVGSACASGQDAGRSAEASEVQAPRFVDVWIGGPLDSIYNAEYERLSGECAAEGDECWVEALDTSLVRLTPVRASPGSGEAAGWLAARLRTRDRWPYAALVLERTDGTALDLVENVGDWGYGSTWAVREVSDGWLRPWLLDAAGGLWLDGSSSGAGFGVVDGPYGLEGRLWQIDAEAGVTPGVYMVLDVADGRVRLRPELPSDMDCGEPLDEAEVARAEAEANAAALEIDVAALLDADGRPRVELAYPKGC